MAEEENKTAEGAPEDEAVKKKADGAEGGGKSGVNPKLIFVILGLNTLLMVAIAAFVYLNYSKTASKPSLADIAASDDKHAAKDDGHGAKKDDGHGGPPADKDKEKGSDFINESFVVNLSDSRGAHIAKVDITIEVDDDFVKDEITRLKPKIRDFINIVIGSKTYEQIESVDGRDFLREEIRNQINGYLTRGKIKNVYFTQLVVQ